MKPLTGAGLGFIAATLIIWRWDSVGLALFLIGVSLLIPELVMRKAN